MKERDKGREIRQHGGDSCPLFTMLLALNIHQIAGCLSIPWDRPVRPLAPVPRRSGYINTKAAFVLVLTPCFTALANKPLAAGLQRSKTPCFPHSIKSASPTFLFFARPGDLRCFLCVVMQIRSRKSEEKTQWGKHLLVVFLNKCNSSLIQVS